MYLVLAGCGDVDRSAWAIRSSTAEPSDNTNTCLPYLRRPTHHDLVCLLSLDYLWLRAF
jgi:hypothetical protein